MQMLPIAFACFHCRQMVERDEQLTALQTASTFECQGCALVETFCKQHTQPRPIIIYMLVLPLPLQTLCVLLACYRQYLNEEQVWSGLVVEVTQRLEEKLGHKQRRLMRGWWIISPWDFLRLLLVPMRLLAGLAYNWKARRTDVVLRCILPSVLVLLVVGACMGFGIWELQQQAKAKAGSAVAVKLDPNTASEELPVSVSIAC